MDSLKALLEERWRTRRGAATDAAAVAGRAIELHEAHRWAEAAAAFEDLLRREGPGSDLAPPALFSLAECRFELGDDRGALEAVALFLELGDERQRCWWQGVENVARAAARLGAAGLAVNLYRVVLGAAPTPSAYDGLARALAWLGRADESLYVLDAAWRSGRWTEALERSAQHLGELAAGRRRPTVVSAPPWTRGRILRAAFSLLGWRREPLPG